MEAKEEVERLASFARLLVGQGCYGVAMERVEAVLEVHHCRAVLGVVGVLLEEFLGGDGELGRSVAFAEGELDDPTAVPGECLGPCVL